MTADIPSSVPISHLIFSFFTIIFLQLKKGGVAKAKGEREKEKECTTDLLTIRNSILLMHTTSI